MNTGRLWRLTRNDYGRALYAALAKRGVKFSPLYVYTRALGGRCTDGDNASEISEEITLETRRGSEFDAVDAVREPEPTDTVVLARIDETTVGYVFCSVSRSVYVHVLDMEVGNDADTAYVWQLHVNKPHRQRGIATAMVERACRVAAQMDDVTAATALVAVDNTPSKALFETTGFERKALIVYGRVFGWSHRFRWELSDDTE